MSTHESTETETLPQWLDRTRRTLARDLREVGQLSRWLRVEAWHRHSDRDLPGGDALTMLGPTARSYERFNGEQDRAEAAYYQGWVAGKRVTWPETADQDTDPPAPLLVIGSWVDIVRKERGMLGAQWQPTIQRELTFLSSQLDWLCGMDLTGRPYFIELDALVYDVARLRRRLEAVLHATPDDHTVPCIRCTGEARGRLHPIWGDAVDGEEDQWRCDSETCGALLTREDYRRALAAAHLLTATALSASQILQQYRVPMATVRKWAERGHVRKHHRDASGRVTYDVEDVLAQQAKQWDGRFRSDADHEADAQRTDGDTSAPGAGAAANGQQIE